ncbi:MAG: energy-coupled thiamine transporter ThiT [Pseudoflavonifractor capillosus]|uniref:energy-coupled thiamine transporter ThiT n=1 Tax=Pseudoflavonifractor capillosus TaxID=106588 RepID=UPI0023F73F35|nr:energy-coupled thiamine transporter ThiT [Pseudoflavonifractor capillosus]MCI5929073.1 energy-coupled thiamine transporter ThiT [Pseudoflavonifractor capillosus]MDY4660138.1 energy-coupled thiamine transporter ThiT [Pseudoflavonifractor capillosus]
MPVVTSSKGNKSTKARLYTRMLCEGAIMVALALVLNQLKIFRLPNGGSITLEMLPIFFYAVRWGVGPGLLAGFAFGLLQMFIDGAVAWGWQSLLLDYLVAFTPLGLAGLFKGKQWGIFAGTVLGSVVRFIVHFISGITIYAIVAPTELFNMTFTSPWMYSLAYNGSYMAIDMALCLVVFGLLYKPLKRYFLGTDIR